MPKIYLLAIFHFLTLLIDQEKLQIKFFIVKIKIIQLIKK